MASVLKSAGLMAAKIVSSASTKLSVCCFAGITGLALMPLGAAPSKVVAPQAEVPIELVRTRPVRSSKAKRPPAKAEPAEPDSKTETDAHSPAESAPAPAAQAPSSPRPAADSAVAQEALHAGTEREPDAWSQDEIITALKECTRLLGPITAVIEPTEPLKNGQCGTPAPVSLKSIGTSVDRIEFRPAVPLNCRMVASLSTWVEKTLQPTAREVLGSPITRIVSGSYSCRNRYNNPNDNISEHAFANAIDIMNFATADGRTVDVLKYWGATKRDLAAADSKAARAKVDVQKAMADPKAKAAAGPVHELAQAQVQAAVSRVAVDEPEQKGSSQESTFLHRLHKGACDVFGTVLGPEANEAHRNHFHLDMAPRRRQNYCH